MPSITKMHDDNQSPVLGPCTGDHRHYEDGGDGAATPRIELHRDPRSTGSGERLRIKIVVAIQKPETSARMLVVVSAGGERRRPLRAARHGRRSHELADDVHARGAEVGIWMDIKFRPRVSSSVALDSGPWRIR
jgi:hypothetical protein